MIYRTLTQFPRDEERSEFKCQKLDAKGKEVLWKFARFREHRETGDKRVCVLAAIYLHSFVLFSVLSSILSSYNVINLMKIPETEVTVIAKVSVKKNQRDVIYLTKIPRIKDNSYRTNFCEKESVTRNSFVIYVGDINPEM